MNETVQFLARHGYWLLFGAVLGRQACLPVPANLFLLAAGALARSGRLSLSGTLGLSVVTFLLADLAWYDAGRRFGDRVLHFLCGLSRNPGSCVHRATDAFANHRVRTLLVSKFVVGLDALSAPLAGAAHIHPMKFMALDALGAMIWSATYVSLGYVFSDQLDRVVAHVARMGAFLILSVAAGFGFYVAHKFANWRRFVRQFKLARITPEQLRDKLHGGENVLVVDLQSRPDSTTEPMAIPGAVRINPRRLEQYSDIEIAPSQEIVLYCACPGEFTSARVALALRQRGIEHVRPLAGGLQAWRDRGFPVSSEVPSIFPRARIQSLAK
jgi:membrane protein DedA with SNARE-associated domain/rhodanese-related sulfurtransferase